MKRFTNASITAKSLLATLISALVLIGVAAIATVTLMDIQRADKASDAATLVQNHTTAAWNDLSRGHAALYRAINLKSQNVEVGLVRAAKDDFAHAIGRAKTAFASLGVASLEINTQLVPNTAKALSAYADAAGQAASFVEEDAFNATMFMTDAEQKYDIATRAFDILAKEGSTLADTMVERMRVLVANVVIPVSALLAVLLSAAITTWLGRLISRPIAAMTASMRRLAEGDLETDLPAVDRADEVGEMAKALLVFRINAQAARELQAAADKTHAAQARRQAAMDRYTNDFGTSAAGVMDSLVRSAETMRGTAGEMSEAAQRTRVDATRTAQGATESSQNLAAVAAAAEEMSASIAEIGQQVVRVTEVVQQAVERASATDSKVSDMAAAADRVNHVVQLINAIAGQTNLLALNATIEAARAGDAGKGFAVVAGEVKALAAQTAKATEEIATHINAIRDATGEAVSAVRSVGETIRQVEQVASAIASAVEEQATVTQDIVASVQTVTAATQDATLSMQKVSEVAEAGNTASRTVLTGADEVARNAATLRVEINQFLQAMTTTDEADRRLYERLPGNGAVARL
jgi:methyl-accepting chemotaxis protein